ncbi:hypothetical protein OG874_07420 [Nocardia sp. NBC_00565]|uniref:hypothetical protein n=1 Tax=Nocardia sp. NBC_00565 TaxID=2975993 RepID=UPI002E809A82|nr:hypothetical protein [Nocardia sp. NBC_00565]WUC04977.1 hypothetical protein OG874_07420 [Nocardia sp. NBC_00565]
MSELHSARTDAAPPVRALLVDFHMDTRQKLDRAPADSRPMFQGAEGVLTPVDEDGWVSDSDADLDKADALTITPISVVDTEAN